MMRRILLPILAGSVFAWLTAQADVKPNALFSNGAVLQQGIRVPVWGTARDGEKITVKFQSQTLTATARGGRWLVRLKPLKPGGPLTMTIAGDNTVTLTNVLVGEVWLCSGQSNMAFPLSRADNAADAIAAAADPQLRLFTVPRGAADLPRTELSGEWRESAPSSASNFSAVAYFFGRDLRKARSVPVGLIHSSVGGTPAEAWTARAALEADRELRAIVDDSAACVHAYRATNAFVHQLALAKYTEAAKRAKAEGRPVPKRPRSPDNPATAMRRPSGLYNAMIAPLQPYALAGVIWYQGEANAGRAQQYQKLFPAMIRNWRAAWGQGAFPFLFVQIAPHERMTPEIREAQLFTWRRVPRTAMAVITDAGNATDIHPTQKEPVGARLALAACAIACGEKLEYSGPVFDSMKVKAGRAILCFKHVGGGLVAQGGELKGFTIAGKDGNFVPATAKIDGNKVVVTAAEVAKPITVRYGWASVPDVNLFNREGLPASPFGADVK